MNKPVSYLQTDPRWKNIPYAVKGEKATIGGSGCGPTCMAMVIATWKDSRVTPVDTCKWSLAHGGKALNQGTFYSYFKPQGAAYGIEVNMINSKNLRTLNITDSAKYHLMAREALNRGDIVIACMGKGNWTNGGHFILLYGVSGNTVYVNDPASTKLNRTAGSWERLKSEVKYYFICKNPHNIKKAPEKPKSNEYISVQKKYGFSTQTMEYLEKYTYAEALFKTLLKSLSERNLNVMTVDYILKYAFGKDVISKICEVK